MSAGKNVLLGVALTLAGCAGGADGDAASSPTGVVETGSEPSASPGDEMTDSVSPEPTIATGASPRPGLFGVEELVAAPSGNWEIFLSFYVSRNRTKVTPLFLRCTTPGTQRDVIAYGVRLEDGTFETGFDESPAVVAGRFVTPTSAEGTITNACGTSGTVRWEAVYVEAD